MWLFCAKILQKTQKLTLQRVACESLALSEVDRVLCLADPFVSASFAVLSKLITSLKDANRLSGEEEMGFLQALLQSREINALVNVHHKVAKIGKDDRLAPVLSVSMQVRFPIK